MRWRRFRPNLLVIFFGGLLALSGIAGVLLYQWINRASEADRMERQQVLDSALNNFRGEFTSAIQEIPATFRPVARIQNESKVDPYTIDLFNQWRSAAHRPQLVETFSIGTREANGNLSFRRYHPQQDQEPGGFEKQEWAEAFGWFREILERREERQRAPFPPTGFAVTFLDGRPIIAFPLLAVTPPGPLPQDRPYPRPPGMPRPDGRPDERSDRGPGRRPGPPPPPGFGPPRGEWGPGRPPPRRPRGPNQPPPRREGAPNEGSENQRPEGQGTDGEGKPRLPEGRPPGGPPNPNQPRRRQGPPFPRPGPPTEGERRQPPPDDFRRRRPPMRGNSMPMRMPPRLIGWCFLELDKEYLEQQLLPELLQKHFSGPALSIYQLAVITNDSQQLIYASNSAVTLENLTARDGEVLLFAARANFGPGFENPPPPPDDDNVSATATSTNITTTGEPNSAVSLSAHAWLLVARHSDGSIAAVVNRSRRQDLMIGYGVLSLLVFSVSLVIFSTHRMRRLAKRQMEFVAGVSHELRTPLSVIQSAGFNLGSGRIKSADRVQQYGNVIQTEGRRLADMIEQMLSFAGIQSGRNQYQFEETQVSDLVEGALHDYAFAFEENGWQIEKNIEENLPPVLADGETIKSAIKNLLQNSLKYASEGKWLRISANANGSRRPEVLITVEDRGTGIDTQDLPHIFEPFYRGRAVLASSTAGAGLGLSLLQRHIKAHGGQVSVKTVLGEGSAFTLHLPAIETVSNGDHREASNGFNA